MDSSSNVVSGATSPKNKDIVSTEVRKYLDDYEPAMCCQFVSDKSSYNGIMLGLSSDTGIENYEYAESFKLGTESIVGELQTVGATRDLCKMEYVEDDGVMFVLSPEMSVVEYDLVTTFHTMLTKLSRKDARRKALKILDAKFRQQDPYRCHVYMRCNAMVMGINYKGSYDRAEGETETAYVERLNKMSEWYFTRISHYVRTLL